MRRLAQDAMLLRKLSVVALCAAAVSLLSGCGSQTVPFPTVTNAYVLQQTVAIPGVPPKSGQWSFGISYFDGATGLYYLTDRTNSAIDVIDGSTLQFVRFAGQGSFAGNVATPSHAAGPNGIVPVGGGAAFAGDGNADVVVVNVNTGATLATIPIPGTQLRVDLLDYDSKDNIVLAISDSSTPWPVGTFISATAPYPILGQITFTNATGGVDQPTYDPNLGKFVESITATSTNPNGQLDVIDPVSEAIVNTYTFSSQCNPAGHALGPNNEMAVSCGRDPNTNAPFPSVIINDTTGAVLATFSGANGCDQAWYNPGDNRFFYACSHAMTGTKKTPNITIVDAGTMTQITTISTASGVNSVTVNPKTNRVFAPAYTGSNIGLNVYYYE
jgi:hypothetical protein